MSQAPDESPEVVLAASYPQHLKQVLKTYLDAAASRGKSGVLIPSGSLKYAFLDDHSYPFKVNPHFKACLPVTDVNDSFIVLREGEKPQLLFHQPEDFWHKTPEDPSGYWVDHWDIHPIPDITAAHNRIGDASQLAFIGEETDLASEWHIGAINDPVMLNAIHFQRAYKTTYEIACLQIANNTAAIGHNAAREAFEAGDSEFAIQQAYLTAIGHREKETPYANIVALNEHCAVLHYQFYEHKVFAPADRYSMLIDAGADQCGYAADVTRTYSARPGLFADLVSALDKEQLAIIDDIEPGMNYTALNEKMHYRVATLLNQFGLVKMTPEAMLETNLTFTFLPHGLGHFLGLQTHDVGGFQQASSGETTPAPDAYPSLRLTRPIEENQVFTIEPGIYFIPMLLKKLRNTAQATDVNWSAIESLLPYGGIRIEDNVAILNGSATNLTRQAFTRL